MTHEKTSGPYHTRMTELSIRHMHSVLKQLCNGSIGFDPFRNEQTATKELCAAYIKARWINEEIDAAHSIVCASYPALPRGPRRQRRAKASNTSASVDPILTPLPASEPVAPFQPAAPAITAYAPIAAPVALPSTANPNDLLAGLGSLIASIVSQQVAAHTEKLQRDFEALAVTLANQAAQSAASLANNGRTVVELRAPNLPPVNLGTQHKNFPQLLKMCNARLRSGHRMNIWLYGPAGTGKTTAAETVAEALGLKFYYNGALDTRYELLGFTDAQSRVVRTAFREAWEHGGVYLFDEIDASNPGALLGLNGGLANSVCPFPDGMIPRHKDCVIIAGANTTGLAGSIEYVGRAKQDASLTNRFAFLDWPLDDGLESAMCADANWLGRVRKVRSNVKSRNVKGVLITPRASIFGEALIAAGLTIDQATDACLRKGIASDVWSQIQ